MATDAVENQEELNDIVAELVKTTVEALEQSMSTKEQFQSMFESCSDHFENGQDAEGYAELQELLDNVKEFATFCKNVQELASCLIPEDIVQGFGAHCAKLEGYLMDLLDEMEKKNFIELSDILRYDLCDCVNAFYPLFETVCREFKECLKQAEEKSE